MQIAEAVGDAEDRLSKLILGPASSLLDTCPRDLWPRLDRLLSNALPKCTQVGPPLGSLCCQVGDWAAEARADPLAACRLCSPLCKGTAWSRAAFSGSSSAWSSLAARASWPMSRKLPTQR